MYLQRVKTRIVSRIPSPFVLSLHPDRAALQVAAVLEQQALLLAGNGLEPKTGLRTGQHPGAVRKYLA
ncbi:MAG: hypothetical protein PVG51_14575 [Desulfosarcina sp.]|jgi:hypothetical protein